MFHRFKFLVVGEHREAAHACVCVGGVVCNVMESFYALNELINCSHVNVLHSK